MLSSSLPRSLRTTSRFDSRRLTRSEKRFRIDRRKINVLIKCSTMSQPTSIALKTFSYSSLNLEQIRQICLRPRQDFPAIMKKVKPTKKKQAIAFVLGGTDCGRHKKEWRQSCREIHKKI